MAPSRPPRTRSSRPPAARSRREAGGRSDLGARVIVAIPAAAMAIVLVAAGGPVFLLGLIVLGLACLHELFAMYDRARPAPLAAAIGLIGLLCAASFAHRETVLMVYLACLPLVFLVTVNQVRGGGAPGISVTMLGLSWVGLAFAHAVLLRGLPHGGALVLAALLGTFVGDTGAYLGGRAFGRTKLAPRISPNKTVEGLAIGMVVATGIVWYVGLTNPWMGGGKGAILGLCIAVAAPLGDLFESYLKRDAGTKDTGRLFGAHGGALDRLDAVMFTMVTTYYVWLALV